MSITLEKYNSSTTHESYAKSVFDNEYYTVNYLLPFKTWDLCTDILYLLKDDEVTSPSYVGMSTFRYDSVYGSLDFMFVEPKYRDDNSKRYGQYIIWYTVEMAKSVSVEELYFYLHKKQRVYSSMIRKNRAWDDISIKTDASSLPMMTQVNVYTTPTELGIRDKAKQQWPEVATMKMIMSES